jgi:DNA polymerase III alpha subunit
MTEVQQLRQLCRDQLQLRGLADDQIYEKRLKWEIAEIKAQDEAGYFLDLHTRKLKFPYNERNLLVCWLLGLCDSVDMGKDPDCVYGEYPDIDVDYLKTVRDYLKNVWAVKEFGADYVCNIGNYATFGIKMAFLDCAKTYGENRHEINAITTELKLKDDEGKALTFDKAMEEYPKLKAYSEKYPHIAEAVKKMLHRNRGMGKHAGGLIIADNQVPEYRIDNLVPLVKNAKDGSISSAWVEGLHGQDLGPVGLIKFDMLVIADLERIALINRLIKKRHGLLGVCAKPETPDWDWSDGSYRCDEKALNLANSGDLLGVFQFDSDGIRKLARDGGVTNFRDIVAYSAIYRPGPLNMGMHDAYIARKHGREKYSIHPLLEPYLGYTYGVMCFQEQVMQVLYHGGGVPLKDTYAVVKAIAKKKIAGFAKYKQIALQNFQKNLGHTEAEANHLWSQIESFAEYGFNRSHSCAYSYVSSRLLYQKANYPLEFWAGTLAVESDADVLNLYRRQANRAGITVNCVDLNRSDETFSICDENDEIYMGFGNIRGVGEAVAKRIVEARGDVEFKGIEDFMNRFGTDAKVMQALIGLRLFKESDPLTLAKFVEHYKDTASKHKARHQRYAKSMEDYKAKLAELVPPQFHKWMRWTEQFVELMRTKGGMDVDEEIEVQVEEKYDTGETQEIEETTYRPKDPNFDPSLIDIDQLGDDELEEVVTKKIVPVMATRTVTKKKKFNAYKQLKKSFHLRARSVKQYEERNVEEKSNSLTLANFNPANETLNPKHVAVLSSRRNSYMEYLGFEWETEMERSPDYNPEKPNTFDEAEIYAQKGKSAMQVDGEIMEVQSRTSKKKTTYHSLILQDAVGRHCFINVWKADWERNKTLLKKGNLVSLIVRPPSNGFKSYSLWSPPWDEQHKMKGVIQVQVLTKAEEEVLADDDFEKKMTELTGADNE